MPEHWSHERRSVLRYLFEDRASSDPDGLCVVMPDFSEWTWRQALDAVYSSANILRSEGVSQNDRVVIMAETREEFVRAWWGVMFLGAVIVPINPAYRGNLLRHVCVDSQASFLISGEEHRMRVEEVGSKLRWFDVSKLHSGSADIPKLDHDIEPWDIHAVFYTSGTTGPSKGVSTTNQMTYSSSHYAWSLRCQKGDVFLLDLPGFHIGGHQPAMGVWLKEGAVAYREHFDGPNYLEVARRVRATVGFLVGTECGFLESTPRASNDVENQLRHFMCVPLPSDPADFMRRFGLESMSCSYGMTEAGLIMVNEDPRRYPRSSGSVPRDGYSLRLVDEHDVEVPKGVPGEVILRSDRPWELMTSYLGRPDATVDAWRNGWFHTGDTFVENDGQFTFVDRTKDSLRRRGENISSFEVECEVASHESVQEVACIGVPATLGEDEVKVLVVLTPGAELEPADLVSYLVPRLPYFMVPRYIEIVRELPKTPTQKVQKQLLREKGNGSETWDRELDGGIYITRRGVEHRETPGEIGVLTK